MEEDEDIKEWLAIKGDDSSDTSIDDTFKDPDYHLPVILDRQPTPIPRAMSEQEKPTRRYSSRIHTQPQRYYTVNAITVKQSDDYLNKNTKQLLFQIQKKITKIKRNKQKDMITTHIKMSVKQMI